MKKIRSFITYVKRWWAITPLERKAIMLAGIVIILVVGVAMSFVTKKVIPQVKKWHFTTYAVNEEMHLPNTSSVYPTDGRIIATGAYSTPIDPTQGSVISDKAIYTVKGAYAVASSSAEAWSKDAALVYIHSQGVVTSDGKSGEWQIVFGSKAKKKGYEVIVFGDNIASQKEIDATAFGYSLPKNWYDSGDALIALRTQLQFANALLSSINFYYNTDGKKWGYALATSNGTVSMPVK